MAYGVYLGDIDPNNTINPVLDIRRNILFKLLLWDSIVMSDSQILTDPRVLLMMDGFRSKEKGVHEDWQDVQEWQKGFEQLLQKGLVEVACRSGGFERHSITDVWETMNRRNYGGRVPFLPHTSAYAEYLDKQVQSARVYNLDQISARFKNNLLSGVETGDLTLSDSDDTDRELKRILNGSVVLFRDILDLLKSQLNAGKITQQRYDEVYRYVYSCYHTNIPAETKCFVCTDFENIPFHLTLGYDTSDCAAAAVDSDALRPTWALDPLIMDLLSIGDFLKIREAVQPCIRSELLMKYNTGTLLPEEIHEYHDVWEEYTRQLEEAMREQLRERGDALQAVTKNQRVSAQMRFKKGMLDLVVNVAKQAAVPAASAAIGGLFSPEIGAMVGAAVGTVVTGAEWTSLIKDNIQNFIMLNSRRNMEYVREQKDQIDSYFRALGTSAKIITKHNG
ncbi:MAG: hypothetical protein IJ496_10945 [Ruminococcus sp.]|nr:hypothetical protein [Ruminococcus sp.]